MGKQIVRFLSGMASAVRADRSVFDFCPSPTFFDMEKTAGSLCVYPTTEEAWSRDWENIGKDFRMA